MTVRTIIGNASQILGMNDVLKLLQNPEVAEFELFANQNFSVLFRCFNLMIANIGAKKREVAPEYKISTADVADAGLGSQGLTYGLLAEYAFVNGMFNEAKVWTTRFENLVFKEVTGRAGITIPRGM